MLFTLEFIHEYFPIYHGEYNAGNEIHHVMTDSRNKQGNALFIPIIGERFDGHKFIHQAIENGAIAVLWDNNHPIPENVPTTIIFYLVEDTLKAMQDLANAYRKAIDPIVIGITGSNGKTTTKDLIYAVVQRKYVTHATKGNFNNDIGLPITILSMASDTEVLILEMGMSHFHEIERLTLIAEPDYAIITNIGESHIEYLGSRKGIAKAKLEIRRGLHDDGYLLIDGDEVLLEHVIQQKNVITCGFTEDNDVILSTVHLEQQKTFFRYNNEGMYHVPLLGKHHAKNASFAVWIGEKLGIDKGAIQEGFDRLSYTAMRFELLKGKHDVTLINDAYNASYTSMKAAINVLKELPGFKRKIVVLGDILELGDYAVKMHKQVGEVISSPINRLYTVGEHAKIITTTVEKKQDEIPSLHYENRIALISDLEKYLNKDTIILFKASRGMRLEEIIDACR